MSAGNLEFAPEALREIDEAFEWYRERSLRAAKAFVQEVEGALALIASSPGIWPRFEAGTRRYVLPKFPYDIVFERSLAASRS